MFECFTEHARRVVVVAAHEAGARRSPTFDAADLLTAIAADTGGVGALALARVGFGPDEIRAANRAEPAVAGGDGAEPVAPDAKAALQAAAGLTVDMGQAAVGTGHLLLALLVRPDGRSRAVLTTLGLDAEAVAGAVVELLASGAREDDQRARTPKPARAPGPVTDVVPTVLAAWAPVVLGPTAERLDDLRSRPVAGDLARVSPWWALDWLVRTSTPAWLDAIGQGEAAATLRALAELTSAGTASAAGAALDAAAGRLAELVPPPIRAADRAEAEADLAVARAAAGEDALRAAASLDVPRRVLAAARSGVAGAMADLVRAHPVDAGAELWDRSVTAARRVAGGDRRPVGSTGSGRTGGDNATDPDPDAEAADASRTIAMRAVRKVAGPAATPLTILEAGLRLARTRRARDRIEDQATRAALVACCRQVVDDASWMLPPAGPGTSAAPLDALVADLQTALLAFLAGADEGADDDAIAAAAGLDAAGGIDEDGDSGIS